MDLPRRSFLMGAAAAGAASLAEPSCAAALPAPVRPEDFGAKGDGVTNDSAAFARLSAFVSQQGGGEVVLRATTYIVGSQRRSFGRDDYAFIPEPIMEFIGCTRPLLIRGHGAVLRCAAGLKFGTFDPMTGRPVRNVMPNYKRGELSSAYKWMIKVERCSGPIEISDFELDGNVGRLEIGGPWGDAGHQLPGTGIGLYDNSGSETVRRVYSHHHPLDGIIIDGHDAERAAASTFEAVRCEYNGRQGCSIVGGYGYVFTGCKFSHTGKAGHFSPPGAGVDIEAEGGKKVRNLRFSGCEFVDNSGPAILADQGDSQDASFSACTFVGSTSWSAWPNKPRMRFSACRFVGSVARAFGDARQPQRAAQFIDCTFLDDPALSPGGRVYFGGDPGGPIANLPDNPNVLFSRCSFRLTGKGVLPWTTNVVLFANCTMSQRSAVQSFPRGHFTGRNTIAGNAILYSAIIDGEVILNGKPMARGPQI